MSDEAKAMREAAAQRLAREVIAPLVRSSKLARAALAAIDAIPVESRPDPVAVHREKIKAEIEVQKSMLRTWYPDQLSRLSDLKKKGRIDGLEWVLALMAEPGDAAGGGA